MERAVSRAQWVRFRAEITGRIRIQIVSEWQDLFGRLPGDCAVNLWINRISNGIRMKDGVEC